MKPIIRETANMRVIESRNTVRVQCKKPFLPRSRVIPKPEYNDYLARLDDRTFENACVLDYGIGVFQK